MERGEARLCRAAQRLVQHAQRGLPGVGKPVVVQDTGWSAHYPSGAGLLAFTTLDEAAAALATVEGDYRRHCEAARAVAERELAAPIVLERLLGAAGL